MVYDDQDNKVFWPWQFLHCTFIWLFLITRLLKNLEPYNILLKIFFFCDDNIKN